MPNLESMICSFIEQGLMVIYIDENADRRKRVEQLARDWPEGMLEAIPGHPIARCGGHCNVVIAVNEHEFSKDFGTDWHMYPALMGNISPVTIHVDI